MMMVMVMGVVSEAAAAMTMMNGIQFFSSFVACVD
jgi:hypothetical protein